MIPKNGKPGFYRLGKLRRLKMELQKKIAEKVKKFRNKINMSQRELAEKMGFQNHQAVLNLEAGTRELKAAELSKLATIFQIDMNDFFIEEKENLTPFVLWRYKSLEKHKESEVKFMRVCRDYDLFEDLLDGSRATLPSALPKCDFNIGKFKPEDAYELAEEMRERMSLGKYPASILVQILEDQFHVRFFSLKLDDKSSAACTWYNEKPCLLVNSSEPYWRQHFSVAHELFHLITWNDDLFKQIEKNDLLNEKNEMLANAFAAGLLMPAEAVKAEINRSTSSDKVTIPVVIALARKFEVSLSACIYRLLNLHIIGVKEAEKLQKDRLLKELDSNFLNKNNRSSYEFGSSFLRLGYLCYEFGKISRARFAKALNVSLVDLPIILNQAGFSEVENESCVEINHT